MQSGDSTGATSAATTASTLASTASASSTTTSAIDSDGDSDGSTSAVKSGGGHHHHHMADAASSSSSSSTSSSVSDSSSLNAFFQDLTVFGFFIIHQAVRIHRFVELSDVRIDPALAEQAFHTKSTGFVRNDWDNVFAYGFIPQKFR